MPFRFYKLSVKEKEAAPMIYTIVKLCLRLYRAYAPGAHYVICPNLEV